MDEFHFSILLIFLLYARIAIESKAFKRDLIFFITFINQMFSMCVRPVIEGWAALIPSRHAHLAHTSQDARKKKNMIIKRGNRQR